MWVSVKNCYLRDCTEFLVKGRARRGWYSPFLCQAELLAPNTIWGVMQACNYKQVWICGGGTFWNKWTYLYIFLEKVDFFADFL